jgi:two-component system response regulator FlrC
MTTKVLIVEDDLGLREALTDTLALEGIAYVEAGSGEEALQLLKSQVVDMVISDVNMPGMDGHALLAQIRQTYPMLPVALITAYGQVERAVDAIRQGAVDYLMKPFEPSQLIELILRYAGGVLDAGTEVDPVAVAPSSQQLLQLARRVAVTDSTVLITGESGTGKEVLARYIHTHSGRVDRPFVAINCAAIPESMLEATLFGHEKGAFTGALSRKMGKFELANKGTLFLDEITEMQFHLQAKLLRVLQEKVVDRVGGTQSVDVDVRVIATTNRDAKASVEKQEFREDLFYRLNTIPLVIPPLRQRGRDVGLLCDFFIKKYCRIDGRSVKGLTDEAASMLFNHGFPGNVRELENIIHRAVLLAESDYICPQDLLMEGVDTTGQAGTGTGETAMDTASGSLKEMEEKMIFKTLDQTEGNRTHAAKILGISVRTLRNKLNEYKDKT